MKKETRFYSMQHIIIIILLVVLLVTLQIRQSEIYLKSYNWGRIIFVSEVPILLCWARSKKKILLAAFFILFALSILFEPKYTVLEAAEKLEQSKEVENIEKNKEYAFFPTDASDLALTDKVYCFSGIESGTGRKVVIYFNPESGDYRCEESVD